MQVDGKALEHVQLAHLRRERRRGGVGLRKALGDAVSGFVKTGVVRPRGRARQGGDRR